jgi:hypothetical protein
MLDSLRLLLRLLLGLHLRFLLRLLIAKALPWGARRLSRRLFPPSGGIDHELS